MNQNTSYLNRIVEEPRNGQCSLYFATDRCKIYLSSLSRTDGFFLFCYNKIKKRTHRICKRKGYGLMRKIVVDMQNFLFADSIATAFRNSDYEIDVIRTESPKDTVELCQVYKPFCSYNGSDRLYPVEPL